MSANMSVNASALIGAVPSATNVTGAIRQAATTTGASFDYLLATAKVESDLNPKLTMRSSSATGLFQFIEQTWLGTMKQAGKTHGYGRYADAIERMPGGRYVVKDPALRNEIMGLRKDPTANAVMAGVFTQQNAAVLGKRIGRMPTEGELYIAHFFGPGGAAKLIAHAGDNPQAKAADIFPAAARANRPIFYDKQGNARSVAGVYTELVRRYQVARANTGTPATQVAAAPMIAPPAPPMPIPRPDIADPAGVTGVLAAANLATPAAPRTAPAFHSLFHTAERREAVAPAVREIWGAQAARVRAQAAQAIPQPAAVPVNAGGSTLDLFQDSPTNVRALFGTRA
jgi:hypothetical protein